MKRIIFFLIVSFSHCLIVHAGNIADVFTSMPDSIFPLLTVKNRSDMVDFYKNKMEAKVRNRLNSYARMDTLTDDYLRLTLSGASEAEMKLLQTEDSTEIICLIRSITAPVGDSQIQFFDKDWQRLEWVDAPLPATGEYFGEAVADSAAEETKVTLADVQRSIDDLRFVRIATGPGAPVFTFTLSVDELNRDEKKLARRHLRTLRYRWTGGRFVNVEQ